MFERLQKILAAHGHGSRRKAEELITARRVTVNGIVAKLGQKADPLVDVIAVDELPLAETGEFLYYLLYKPLGVVSTNIGKDTLHKAPLSQRATTRIQAMTVRDLLPAELRGRIVSVGRLDKDSEGLLLLTNDGALAHRMMHPRFEHEKEYEVTVDKTISSSALYQLKNGVMLDGVLTKRAAVNKVGDRAFRIILTEGRNRQIRRMCERVGLGVIHLKRIRFGPIQDNRMHPGDFRPLKRKEIEGLRAAIKT